MQQLAYCKIRLAFYIHKKSAICLGYTIMGNRCSTNSSVSQTSSPEPAPPRHHQETSSHTASNTSIFDAFTHSPLQELPIEHVLLITNPHSGSKKSKTTASHVIRSLESSGYTVEVCYSEYPGHVYSLIEDIDDITSYHAILPLGGDGTVHQVIDALLLGCVQERYDLLDIPPVCILPSGSGNTIAFTLGYSTVEEGLEALKRAKPRLVDIMQITQAPSLDPKPETPAANDPSNAANFHSPSLLPKALELNSQVWDGRSIGPSSSAHCSSAEEGRGRRIPTAMQREETEDTAAPEDEEESQDNGAENNHTKSNAAATATEAGGPSRLHLHFSDSSAYWAQMSYKGLSQYITFSINMVGYGLTWSILSTANSLRWMGSAQYNMAAAFQILSMRTYRLALEFVVPTGQSASTAEIGSHSRLPVIDEKSEYKSGDHVTGIEGDTRSSPQTQQGNDEDNEAETPDPAKGNADVESKDGSKQKESDASSDDANTKQELKTGDSGNSSTDRKRNHITQHTKLEDLAAYCSWNELTDDRNQLNVSQTEYSMIQIQNTVHIGEKMALCPYAKVDDGLFDVILMTNPTRMEAVKVLDRAKKSTQGEHLNASSVSYLQASELILRPVDDETARYSDANEGSTQQKKNIKKTSTVSGPNTLNIDGEVSGFSPFRMDVLPRVLRMLC
eukprot:gb/GECG01013236.1/.p1 GENE.gb/GECG01013236.1/~~gb/GECG01013236.1/.p1  ORF type:complete len:675 (+),score=94.49 gb/GECG01013236.1/:1-2025(+)